LSERGKQRWGRPWWCGVICFVCAGWRGTPPLVDQVMCVSGAVGGDEFCRSVADVIGRGAELHLTEGTESHIPIRLRGQLRRRSNVLKWTRSIFWLLAEQLASLVASSTGVAREVQYKVLVEWVCGNIEGNVPRSLATSLLETSRASWSCARPYRALCPGDIATATPL
jgi:hypothetical protein